MRAILLACVLLLGGAPAAPTQVARQQVDLNAETRALVQRMVLDSAAAIAAVKRLADEDLERAFAELAAKDRRLRAEVSRRATAREELARVTAERQRLVAELAARDRRFAAEIEEYRRQVASIAGSPDPRRRHALERYAEGDRDDRDVAFDTLVAIQRAETRAAAAGWREIGALAADRKDRGEMDTAQVIEVYEEAQKLDPEYAWGWIELARLYREAGRLADGRRAAEEALARVASERDQSAAEMGLADILIAAGDLAAARARFEQSLAIHERLAAANPTSAAAQRDLMVSHVKLGGIPGGEGHWSEGLKIALELQRSGRLAPRDAWMIDGLRERAAAAGVSDE